MNGFHGIRVRVGVLALVVMLVAAGETLAGSRVSQCGGDDQRACCPFTSDGVASCDPGHVEIASIGEACPGGAPGSAGHCVALTACGRAGQRGCCVGNLEYAPGRLTMCEEGAAPLSGCEGNCYCGGTGTGAQVGFTCVDASSPCGGIGERGCCFIERGFDACDAGLIHDTDLWPDEFFPGSGDATCSDGNTTSRSSGACVPEPWTDYKIDEPQAGWTAAPGPRGGPLRGYLDMHMHLVAHLAHGKKVFSGEPAPVGLDGKFTLDPAGGFTINWALSPARDRTVHNHGDHGLGMDSIGDGTKDGSRSEYGAPFFTGWPRWTTTTHQQAYYGWLERAWRGGLRMITQLAITNEALCKSTRDVSDWPTHCDRSMPSIDEQLAAARDFERFIDERAGHLFTDGQGGWFRIVETPARAREVIASGRMAVVLGIEVDNLFNCKERNQHRPAAPCPDMRDADGNLVRNAAGEPIDTIAKAVAHYHALGVRHVFPVHNFDNAFGAAATWQDVIGIGQALSEQRWWVPRDCGSEPFPYGFWLNSDAAQGFIEFLGFADGSIIPSTPEYTDGNASPNHASCNFYGLNLDPTQLVPDTRGLGRELIQSLMAHGMIIDVDHMSNRSLDDTLVLMKQAPGSDAAPYPVVAGHVQFFDLHEKEFTGNKGRHERMRTLPQLDAIAAGGGMIAAMLKDDLQDTDLRGQKYTLPYVPEVGATIADDCRHSSKTWAQALQYAVDVMNAPVAMGSDFNGIAGHVGPRFGSDACGGWEAFPSAERYTERLNQERARNRVQYPFTLPGLGTFSAQETGPYRTFDYNVDGLAHVGLLPDMVADLSLIGLDDHYIDKLMCSAEQYIRVWERAEALAAGQPAPDLNRPWQCGSPTSLAAITVDVVTVPAGRPRALDFTVAGGPAPITDAFQLRDASAPYTTPDLAPGTYTLTVGTPPPAGWSRTVVCTGGPFGASGPYGSGEPIALGAGDSVICTVTDTLRSTAGFCPSAAKAVDSSSRGRWPGNRGMDLIVQSERGESIQDAIDNLEDFNGDGYLLLGVQGKPAGARGGFGFQRVVIDKSYSRPVGVVGCSVRLLDPAPHEGRPVVDIRASAQAPSIASTSGIVVIGLYAENSTGAAGYEVAGNGRVIQGAESSGNGVGIRVTGNGNTIDLGSYSGNLFGGIAVTGSGNTVSGVKALSNGGHGVQVAGDGNKVLKVIAGDTGRGNRFDGVNIAGRGNEVGDGRMHANGGDGIEVTGGTATSPNVVRENLVGRSTQGNGGHGIFVHADGGGGPGGTVEIRKNVVKANAMDGIHVAGSATGHDLQGNQSGGRGADSNGGCEYSVSAGNFNAGRNTADGQAVLVTTGNAFPTGCLGSP